MSAETIATPTAPINNKSSLPFLKSMPPMRPGSIFLFLYVAVLARQIFWTIGNSTVEWMLTLAVSAAVIWILRFRTEAQSADRLPLSYWLIVAMPLIFVFLLRVSTPDTAYDVINYRLTYAERSLHGAQFLEGDFFPGLLSLNPAADTLTGLFRYALGYRLGTIVNLFALLWTAAILYRMLAVYVSNELWRSTAIFAILSTEQILFQVNGYMVDLLTVPLILEATRRTIRVNDEPETIFDVAFVAFLLGVSCAFKLTNMVFALPLGGMYFFDRICTGTCALRFRVMQTLAFAVAFMLPLVTHGLYMYSYTGSPIFPIYNAIFHSPYFPFFNLRDQRWGAKSIWEAFLYPVMSFAHPERLWELGYYSGRVAIGAVLAAICLLVVRRDKQLLRLSFLILIAGFLWSFSSGYIRYVLPLEVYGGVCAVLLLSHFAAGAAKLPIVRFVSTAAIVIVFGIQIFITYENVLSNKNTGWAYRPVGFSNQSRPDMHYLLRDYSLWEFQPADNQKLIEQVEVWVVSDGKTSGVEVLLNNELPILNVFSPEFFHKESLATDAARELYVNTLSQLKERRMFSLCYAEHFDAAIRAIERAGLQVVSTMPLHIPFYSYTIVLNMVFIEVVPNPVSRSTLVLDRSNSGGNSG